MQKNIFRLIQLFFILKKKKGSDAETNDQSLQIDDNIFLESTIKFDDFLNHSCEPNCIINWETLNLISLKNIRSNEELTYNYNISEYDIHHLHKNFSFKCKCKSKECINLVEGFFFLDKEDQQKLLSYASPFIQKATPSPLLPYAV